MKTFTKPSVVPGGTKGQANTQHKSNDPEMKGVRNDNNASAKMKTVPKPLMVVFITLLAIFMAKNAGAQTDNYINLTTGSGNVYDHLTPPSITTASQNAFFGNNCGYLLTSGGGNTLFGNLAGFNIGAGGDNTCIGLNSGFLDAGAYNTYVGENSGANDMFGIDNIALGASAGFASGVLSDAAAIGSNATASYSNEMVFGDGNVTKWGFGEDVTAMNAVMQVNCGAGAYIYVTASGGGWSISSDRKLKENFKELDESSILQKVMNLPITQWNYKLDPSREYIGPMAQDFYSAFHLGNDSTHIAEIEPGDIALVAIKALGKQNANLANQNQVFQQTVVNLQTQNTQLQNSVSDLQDKFNTVLAEIENLKTLQAQCCGNIGVNTTPGGSNRDNSGNGQPSLSQNAPNPFSENTVISYYLPSNMSNAEITVRTLSGTVLKTFSITSPGTGQVTVNAGTLAPGTYEYDMISNNQIIDSKKMMIVAQ